MLSLSVFLSTILLSNGLSSSSSSPRSLNRHYLNPSSSSSSSSPSGDDEHDLSPWASATWLLTLDFAAKQASLTDTDGTTNANDDTPPFSSYGVSGSHLVVTFPVVVDSDDDPVVTTRQEDPFIGRGASVLRPYSIKKDGNTTNTDTADEEEVVGSMIQNENNFQYITINGTQRIEVSNGGWVLKFPPSPSRGKSTKLKFYFDLLTDLERNDIYLPANTRLYGTADTWRDQTYEDGKQRLRPIRAAYEDAQQQLEEQVSHDTGDRRLDGTGTPLDTFAAYTEMTALVVRRDQTRTAYRTAIQTNQGGGGPGGSGHGYPVRIILLDFFLCSWWHVCMCSVLTMCCLSCLGLTDTFCGFWYARPRRIIPRDRGPVPRNG